MSIIYPILKHSHSGLRWVVLLFLVGVVLNSGIRYFMKKEFRPVDQGIGLIALSLLHLQLLIGIILYFVSPMVIFSAESMGNALLRFFLVEHSSLMLVAIILTTLGYSLVKKAQTQEAKHLRLFLFFGIGLLIIIVSIPWPWRALGGGWI